MEARSTKKEARLAFRQYFLRALLLSLLPISVFFFLLIRSTTREFTDYMQVTEQKQVHLLEQTLAAEFSNASEIVRGLLVYQDVRPFYLQHFPSHASDLIRNLNNHYTNKNIVDEIYMHFFCDEYFYSTKTSFSVRSFMNQVNLPYSGGADASWAGDRFLLRMEQAETAEDTFFLRDVAPKQSASSLRQEKAILYVYPYVVDNVAVGAVIFQLNEAHLNAWIGNSAGRDTYIFDRTGALLNAGRFGQTLSESVTEKWMERLLRGALRGETRQESRGAYYVLSGSISDTGLYYIRFVENKALYAALEKIQLMYILLLLVLAALACAAFAALSKPLRKMKEALSVKAMADFSAVDSFLDSYNDLKNTNLQFQDEVHASARRDFLHRLLEHPVTDGAAVVRQGEAFGLNLTAPYHFVAIGRDEFQSEENLLAVLPQSGHFRYLIAASSGDGRTSWLVGCDCFLDRRRLQNAAQVGRLSVSGTRTGVERIHDAYLEARSYWDVANAPLPYYRQLQRSIDAFNQKHVQYACRQMEEGRTQDALDTVHAMYQKMKAENMPPDIQCQILTRIIFFTDQLLSGRVPERKAMPLDASSLVFAEDPLVLLQFFEQQTQALLELERREARPPAPALTLEAVLAFVRDNCESENFSLGLLADHFAISVSYLSLFFKENYGETLLNYYTGLRMAKARHLLDTTDMPLREVVAAVGYSNTSSFIRRFKQLYGMTPGEYKKKGMASKQANPPRPL